MTTSSSSSSCDASRSRTEELTDDFYAWERRGRGWQIWDYPVELEPPFVPFFGYSQPTSLLPDDGYRETIRGSIGRRVREALLGKEQESREPEVADEDEPTPGSFVPRAPLVEMELRVPLTEKITGEISTRLIHSLPHAAGPISFEILGTPDSIRFQFACQEEDYGALRAQLRAFFPNTVVSESQTNLAQEWVDRATQEATIVDFGLSHEFMLPIASFRSFDVDPLIGFVGALDTLKAGELGVVQILFQPVRHPWCVFRSNEATHSG